MGAKQGGMLGLVVQLVIVAALGTKARRKQRARQDRNELFRASFEADSLSAMSERESVVIYAVKAF